MGDEAEKDVVEGSQTEEQGKYAPLTKYIGVKEMLKREEDSHTASKTRVTELETEVKNLGEQLKAKSGVDPTEFQLIKDELGKRKTQDRKSVV